MENGEGMLSTICMFVIQQEIGRNVLRRLYSLSTKKSSKGGKMVTSEEK